MSIHGYIFQRNRAEINCEMDHKTKSPLKDLTLLNVLSTLFFSGTIIHLISSRKWILFLLTISSDLIDQVNPIFLVNYQEKAVATLIGLGNKFLGTFFTFISKTSTQKTSFRRCSLSCQRPERPDVPSLAKKKRWRPRRWNLIPLRTSRRNVMSIREYDFNNQDIFVIYRLLWAAKIVVHVNWKCESRNWWRKTWKMTKGNGKL